jgi:hypothetical protein
MYGGLSMREFWPSEDGRTGWQADAVIAAAQQRFGDRPLYIWLWGAPFMVNSRGPRPVVITEREDVATVALLAGEDVAFIPAMMGPPDCFAEAWD